ncbi:MAG TPA: hypothetical protein VMG12_13865 [Polyangiaceae bacterium]|nr:hypothetical protein [Polyangiaceae bacterium]
MTKGLDVLQLIQDVDWVVGSFVADPNGELLIYLMPPEFGEDELRRTATRLASIVRSAEMCGVDVEQCEFSFSRYQLMVFRSEAGVVGVLVEAPVSRRALSMAARIALAELPRLVASLEEASRSATSAESSRAVAVGGGEAPRTSLPLDRFGPIASVTRSE